MVRCSRCGHTMKWSIIGIQPCQNCGQFLIMPDLDVARALGIFDVDYVPPYIWTVRQDEAVLIFDGLQLLMDVFQHHLADHTSHNAPDELVGSLSGSYVYAKMTRDKFLKIVPDLLPVLKERDG